MAEPLSKGFRALVVTQFLGALNDNIFKFVISFLILETRITPETESLYLGLARATLLIPFILVSSYAGYFADRFSKTIIIRITRGIELGVMLTALHFLAERNIPALVCSLLLLGVHSATFSPCKYGIVPDLVKSYQLSRANGFLELWTFLAIIFGGALGTVLKVFSDEGLLLPGVAMVTIASCGLCTSFFIPHRAAADPNKQLNINPISEFASGFRKLRTNRSLLLTCYAVTFFWFAGALLELTAMLFGKHLGLSEGLLGIVLTALALGTAAGCIGAGVFSRGNVELGLVPLGAMGLCAFTLLLGLVVSGFWGMLICMAGVGVSAGLFIVPLNAYMQRESPTESRGSLIALNNMLSYSAMLLASFLPWMLIQGLGLTAAASFLLLSVLSVVASVIIVRTIPEMLVRCINWIVSNLVYSATVIGKENVPSEGGALIVCNHVSFADPPLILAALSRSVRFLMFRPIFELPFVKQVATSMRAIPVSATDSPKSIVASLNEARDAVLAGDLVGIFAEGAITRTGQMLPFSKGLERIMRGTDRPIIPVHIDQMWGSIFSYHGGKFFWKRPKRVPYPVTVTFGAPLPATASVHDVRRAIQELGTESFSLRKQRSDLLHVGFVRAQRQRPLQRSISDSSGKSLKGYELISVVLALGSMLRKRLGARREMVGVILPPSIGGVLANLGLLFSGNIPVNINYTAGPEHLRSVREQCQMKRIISSAATLEKLGMQDIEEVILLENLVAEVSFGAKLWSLLSAYLPLSVFRRVCSGARGNLDDCATVLFSSGSTGEPKGVKLSHRNITSNIESLYDIWQLDSSDCIFGVLPFFHSFGLTGTLWLPLLGGIRATYHFNPMDSATIGEIAQRERVTILLSTPTFLLGYLRRCTAEQFGSLRRVVTGAEKLKDRVAKAFEEKFGVLPMEGYGCTELSPVAMINIPSVETDALSQIGNKPGTVGQPLPGVSVRIVHPESLENLAPGAEGMLLVKGPNVMLGYLNQAEKTAEVVKDGWYITGDIASIDADGFVTILDRLSRFSKIGGEMVPHLKIEEEMHRVAEQVEQVFVVTGVPDEKKGERLVVLSRIEVDAAFITKQLGESGMPNLWIPKKESFFRIEEFPLLGTGKLDLRAIKEIAKQFAHGSVDEG